MGLYHTQDILCDSPKIESDNGERASKKGNKTKNQRLKKALNVIHFHDDEE